MFQVSEKEVKNRLSFDNPWWSGERVAEIFRQMPKRAYLGTFYKLVAEQAVTRAVVLMGPRRVGKTVMVYHCIQKLLDAGIAPSHILYLSLETPVYTGLSLEKLIGLFQNQFSHTRNKRLFIFFDEIQYLKEWEVHLKSLVDSYPNYRFVATGSAAAALKLKSDESGAGRFTDFMLPPLTFAEYLRFIEREQELVQQDNNESGYIAKDIEKLNDEFINYLNYGGYPEAVFSKDIQSQSGRYIKSDIIDKVLLRDLPSLYGISDIQELNRLFTTLAYNTGNEISLEDLSQSAGVAKNTLRRYLDYLEAAFLIRRVHRVDQNARHFKRITTFKVYLTNPSMRAALFGPVDQNHEAMGTLTETAIVSQSLHISDPAAELHYARWNKGEIDIVLINKGRQKVSSLIEIKWSDRIFYDPKELATILEFIKLNSLSISPIVTTKTLMGKKIINNCEVKFYPSSLYCYAIGNLFQIIENISRTVKSVAH